METNRSQKIKTGLLNSEQNRALADIRGADFRPLPCLTLHVCFGLVRGVP